MAKLKTGIVGVTGRTLGSTLYTNATQKERNGVLLIHGLGSNRNSCAQYGRLLAKAELTCLTIDLGGHGESDGERAALSVSDHVVDVVSGYNYLARQPGIASGKIALFGISYGGYLGMLSSSQCEFNGMLLRAAPLYPNTLLDKPRADYTDTEALQTKPDLNNLALMALQNFDKPVTVVASQDDALVPAAITNAIIGAAAPNVTTYVLDNAGHTLDAASQKAFLDIVTAWGSQIC